MNPSEEMTEANKDRLPAFLVYEIGLYNIDVWHFPRVLEGLWSFGRLFDVSCYLSGSVAPNNARHVFIFL